jgi:putative methyltransferase (TIGR04325 family)
MSQMKLEDYPLLYWLKEVIPQGGCVLDAGGHMGTKYRAFQNYLGTSERLDWWIYDLPAIVRAGKQQALKDGLTRLKFVDDIDLAPTPDVFIGSGLLQYLDVPLSSLLSRLVAKPRHLLLNKVATREGLTVVTLENFGVAEVPYQIRNRADFTASLAEMGYHIVDEWTIPHISHAIPGHPQLGTSSSHGYYAVLD